MFRHLRLILLTGLTLGLCQFRSGLASEYTSVEIGNSRQYLRNQATSQDKHYIDDDAALDKRIGTLLGNMDALLAALHALPPELGEDQLQHVVSNAELLRLVQLGLDNNPELKPYRTTEAAQAARTRQAGARMDPMAMFEFMNFPAPQFPLDDSPMTMIRLGLSQTYEGYGKRKLRMSISNLEERLTEYSLAQRELDLVGEISDAYFELMQTQARLRVLDENIGLMQVLIELAGVRAGLGQTSQAMLIEAQLQLSMLTEKRVMLLSMHDKQRNMLSGLLGNPAEFADMQLELQAQYPLVSRPEIDNGELYSEALDRRPDYQKLELMHYQQDLMVELAARGYHPDYTISTSIGFPWGMRSMVSAGISIPLFTHKEERQDAALQEAEAERAGVDDMQAMLTNTLATQITAVELQLAEDSDIVALYRDALVPQARLALESQLRSYSAEGATLDELITTQLELLNLQQELELRHISYLANLARLQVLTAGAFDPAPYLLGQPDFADIMDGVSELAEQAVRDGEQETVARERNPFIDELQLPDDIPPISLPDGEEPDSAGESND